MPVHVRNFWITTFVEGAAVAKGAGPKSKDGGFSTKVQMREAGQVTTAATITGRALPNGRLRLEIESPAGVCVWSVETDR